MSSSVQRLIRAAEGRAGPTTTTLPKKVSHRKIESNGCIPSGVGKVVGARGRDDDEERNCGEGAKMMMQDVGARSRDDDLMRKKPVFVRKGAGTLQGEPVVVGATVRADDRVKEESMMKKNSREGEDELECSRRRPTHGDEEYVRKDVLILGSTYVVQGVVRNTRAVVRPDVVGTTGPVSPKFLK